MKRYAVLLGTEQYDDFNPTAFCHNDVKILKRTLVENCDFAEQDVYMKLLKPDDALSPTDILAGIEDLANKSKDGDTILFYYAGHGGNIKDESYLILPKTKKDNIEKTALPLRDVSNTLRKDGRINVRIFDACHSGQDVRADQDDLNCVAFTRDILSGSEEGWITLAACRWDECSYSDPRLSNGVFTYYLVEAIKEFKDNEEIFPELLKISVCNKVKNWCDNNSSRQTPTFNSAISGNIAFIIRKPIVSSAVVTDKSTIEESSGLRERLAEIKKYQRADTEEGLQKLEEYINKSRRILEEKIKLLDTLGLEPSISEAMYADDISYDLKPLITQKIDNKSLLPLHDVQIYRTYEEPKPLTLFQKALSGVYGQPERKLKSVEHIIQQDPKYPKSAIEIDINSDDYVPNTKAFLYIVPLRLSACMVCGYMIWYDGIANQTRSSFEPVFLSLNEDRDISLIEDAISKLLEKISQSVNDLTEGHLNYLESEINRVK